jgi:hypothetical protein
VAAAVAVVVVETVEAEVAAEVAAAEEISAIRIKDGIKARAPTRGASLHGLVSEKGPAHRQTDHDDHRGGKPGEF